jgi:hypothetical protein
MGVADLSTLIASYSKDGTFVDTNNLDNAAFLKKYAGDVVLLDRKGKLVFIEVKTEKDYSINLFLEEWSSRDYDFRTEGWMRKIRCDLLFYYFKDVRTVYVIPFRKLWEWSYGKGESIGAIGRYPESAQKKYDQPNMSIGRLVPSSDIRDAVGLREFEVLPDRQWVERGKARRKPNTRDRD